MTIEQLINGDSIALKEIEAMSSADLLKYFEPFLKVTRPELAEKPEKSQPRSMSPLDIEKQRKLEKARQVAKQFGLDLGL